MCKCKRCGNPIAEQVYFAQNGMCHICLNIPKGGNDSILSHHACRQSSVNTAHRDVNEFHADDFANKRIEEYRFPSFITSELISQDDASSSENTWLLSSPNDNSGCARMVYVGCYSPFIIASLFVFYLIITDESTTARNIVAILIFSLIWYGFLFSSLNLFLRHYRPTGWILLKEDHLECYLGRKFKFTGIQKIPLENLDISYHWKLAVGESKQSKGTRRLYRYYEMVLKPAHGRKFKFSVNTLEEAKYWQSFLQWYCSQKTAMRR